MNQIKKFVDKIVVLESRQAREIIIPLNDAKELRDEITKLLLDLQESTKTTSNEVLEVVVRGNKW